MHTLKMETQTKLIRTYLKRPDLLMAYPLSEQDKEIIESFKKQLKKG